MRRGSGALVLCSRVLDGPEQNYSPRCSLFAAELTAQRVLRNCFVLKFVSLQNSARSEALASLPLCKIRHRHGLLTRAIPTMEEKKNDIPCEKIRNVESNPSLEGCAADHTKVGRGARCRSARLPRPSAAKQEKDETHTHHAQDKRAGPRRPSPRFGGFRPRSAFLLEEVPARTAKPGGRPRAVQIHSHSPCRLRRMFLSSASVRISAGFHGFCNCLCGLLRRK